ncbi:MAG TPA: hypothetical protein VHT21_21420 [Stellaceae bacterium]|jgi:hypothetical protein|nr:hypothetical protein [Stellaceae bacterium]
MRAQSAALGLAAAAAFSSAATALPCGETALGKTTTSEFACTVSDKTLSPLAYDQQGEPRADSQPPLGESALFLDVTEAGDVETFTSQGIKITNLQATMTSNRYVAGRLPTAAQTNPVEDLIMFYPDYLSTKMLPRIPKRNSVGVGLVTVPKPPVKEPDPTPAGQWFPQPRR